MPDSFLPHIQSVFYAVFDVKQGPKIVYQVPEDLIVSSSPIATPLSALSIPSTPSVEYTPPEIQAFGLQLSPTTSNNHASEPTSLPDELRTPPRILSSLNTPPSSAQRALFSFDDVHKYIIPHSALCGRLVICSVQNYRIIGLPVALKGRQYERNYFRYNICFVFERGADLSCYEPIVRKVSRVLTSCEEESRFLSMPSKSTPIHAILEQLYEDLNSYAETSIPIDRFNSIELKIFPFYPNPPLVHDWLVPIALINLTKRIDDNWDLTMAKICKFIDGTNHVSRIAHLADCDIKLTRQAISHLLYHQVIMTIDIFQYSNMYTLRKSMQWLADEIHVEEECGPYVTKPGNPIPDWPKLLHLYSRLKAGKTVYEWQEEYEVEKLGVDVRRFTSFGVIKGFLRRVHRWPVYLSPEIPHQSPQLSTGINISLGLSHTFPRKRGQSMSDLALRYPLPPPQANAVAGESNVNNSQTYRGGMRLQTAAASTITFPGSEHANAQGSVRTTGDPHPVSAISALSSVQRARRASAAERVLEQLRNRDKTAAAAAAAAAAAHSGSHGGGYASPRNSWIPFHHQPRDLLYSQQANEPSLSSTPPTHTTQAGSTTGGQNKANNNGSGTVTPTMTAATLHGHGYGPSASGSAAVMGIGPGATLLSGSPHGPHSIHHHVHSNSTTTTTTTTYHSQTHPRRRERIQSSNAPAPPPSPIMANGTLGVPSRPRISRSPSALQIGQNQLGSGGSGGGGGGGGSGNSTVVSGSGFGGPPGGGSGAQPMQGRGSCTLGGGIEYPPQLMPLLDGEHHTDELCTMFEVGWPLLEKWLELIGGGDIGGEDCRVVIIYR